MQELSDIQEIRLRQVENLLSTIVEGQSNLAQVMQEHARRLERVEARLGRVEARLERVETRLERVEELLTLALDDLAFIRDILKPKQ